MKNDNESYAKIFKALSDEKRLCILQFLRDGEKCACVLSDLIEMKQSALSYQMKVLCESGLVNSRQEGKWMYYSLSETGGKRAAELLIMLTTKNNLQNSNKVYLENLETPSM